MQIFLYKSIGNLSIGSNAQVKYNIHEYIYDLQIILLIIYI